MKIFGIFAGCGLLGFLLMGVQMGLIQPPAALEETVVSKPVAAKPKARKEFPKDLAPVIRGTGVPEAAGFKKENKAHPLVFLLSSGNLHSWQEKINKDDWIAESVEGTELVVVLGRQRKIHVEHIPYRDAPAVDRYKFELDVHVFDAKSGQLLASKRFVSNPRPINQVEDWGLTALGEPVKFREVFNWIYANADLGFRFDQPTARK